MTNIADQGGTNFRRFIPYFEKEHNALTITAAFVL